MTHASPTASPTASPIDAPIDAPRASSSWFKPELARAAQSPAQEMSVPLVPPLPWGMSYDTPLEQKSVQQLAIEMLPLRDAETEYYRPKDIARVLPISPSQVRKHCEDLWGDGERKEWRLKFSQVCALIKRIVFTGRSCPNLVELRQQHQELMQKRASTAPGEAAICQRLASQDLSK